jgi:DNA-binding response OmpR family regulator
VSERPWKVVVVDDSDVSLAMLHAILEQSGFEVRCAATIDEFNEIVKIFSPDVIVSDVSMPGMSGVELCRTLKAGYDTAHVPIVLCSGRSSDELAVLAANCGADGYLSKADVGERLAEELRLLCRELAW